MAQRRGERQREGTDGPPPDSHVAQRGRRDLAQKQPMVRERAAAILRSRRRFLRSLLLSLLLFMQLLVAMTTMAATLTAVVVIMISLSTLLPLFCYRCHRSGHEMVGIIFAVAAIRSNVNSNQKSLTDDM